jgi:hypothetical protein
MLDVVIYVLLAAGTLVVVDLLYFGVLEPYRKGRGARLWWIALLGPFGLAGLLTVIGRAA